MNSGESRTPAEAFFPGEFIQEEIKERGWSQEDFARIIGKPLPTVNQIIKGKRAIIPETAKKIAAAFGNSPQFWMNLETSWQLYNSESTSEQEVEENARLFTLLPIREMQRRQWIRPTKTTEELTAEVAHFFGDSSFSQAARMSVHNEEAHAAVKAWCRRALLIAQMLNAARFTKSQIPNLIRRLRLLFGDPEEIRHVPKILAEFGIRFVIVEHLKGTHLDGASVSASETRPVVALSLRFGRLDHFWFTLVHEIAHIYHGDGERQDINLLEKKAEEDDAESLANTFAEDTLIPSDQMGSFILRTTPLFTKDKIVNFSRRMGVHPAMVIGQLKHRLPEEEFGWNRLSRLHNRVDVRDIIKSTAMYDGWGHVAPIPNKE